MTKIISKPFDWNDNLSEIALEDFSMIQKKISYGACQTIGMALAKLELLEKQGCKVEPQKGAVRNNDKRRIYRVFRNYARKGKRDPGAGSEDD